MCSKITNTRLRTVLEQKMCDIQLNTQFCPKNVGNTRIFSFEKVAHNS